MKFMAIFSFLSFMPAAYADEAAASAHGSTISSMLLFGAMFVMMYFLMIRPQSKRAKELRNLVASLAKDDEVVTQGGMIGKFVRDTGSFFIITLGSGMEVPVQKQSIVQVLPKGTIKSIC